MGLCQVSQSAIVCSVQKDYEERGEYNMREIYNLAMYYNEVRE